jgi:hypothetical protein
VLKKEEGRRKKEEGRKSNSLLPGRAWEYIPRGSASSNNK